MPDRLSVDGRDVDTPEGPLQRSITVALGALPCKPSADIVLAGAEDSSG